MILLLKDKESYATKMDQNGSQIYSFTFKRLVLSSVVTGYLNWKKKNHLLGAIFRFGLIYILTSEHFQCRKCSKFTPVTENPKA